MTQKPTYKELERRIRVLESELLKRDEIDLERAQRVAHIGSWTYDPATQLPTWSKEMFRIFGMAPGTEAPAYEEHRSLIHPEDWDRFDAAVSRAITEGVGYNLEIRIIRPDGEVRYVQSLGEATGKGHGGMFQLIGTTQDIHERKVMEETLKQNERRYERAEKMGNFGH